MNVVKRNGTLEPFDSQKIFKAVMKAANAVEETEFEEIAEAIAKDVESLLSNIGDEVNIEDIQDLVEIDLYNIANNPVVAKAYITYRFKRAAARNYETSLFKELDEKYRATNVQNQNANVDEMSFGGRKGEADSVVAKKMAIDYLLSDKAKYNHTHNRIYIHDLDNYVVGCHNCFVASTEFITSNGIKKFSDYNDGDSVTVLGPDGRWYPAIVKHYGRQPTNLYRLKKNRTEILVQATPNHRWFLIDGQEQEGLKVGDKLLDSPYFWEDFDFDELSSEDKKYWCFGFIYGDGTLETRFIKSEKRYRKNGASKVKLCGNKRAYLTRFQSVGWGLNCWADEPEVSGVPYDKTLPDFESLPLSSLIAFIHGYYDADGTHCLAASTGKPIYSIQTSSIEASEFIEKYFPVAGLYINSIKDKTGQETNFGIRKFTKNYQFTGAPSSKFNWYVKSIEPGREEDVWCLEVESIHAFVLAGGIPTGNCLTLPFDDLLAKGFNTRQTDVRPAGSVNTAFQLVAVIFQLQSLQQFGGVSASHLDWTMVPYVRKNFYKHYVDGLKYLEDQPDDWLAQTINDLKDNNPSITDDVFFDLNSKVYKYALDMTRKEVHQGAEGLFHNLNTLQSRSGNQLNEMAG